MTFTIEVVKIDNHWVAEVLVVPGAIAYGKTYREAISRALDILENQKAESEDRKTWSQVGYQVKNGTLSGSETTSKVMVSRGQNVIVDVRQPKYERCKFRRYRWRQS